MSKSNNANRSTTAAPSLQPEKAVDDPSSNYQEKVKESGAAEEARARTAHLRLVHSAATDSTGYADHGRRPGTATLLCLAAANAATAQPGAPRPANPVPTRI